MLIDLNSSRLVTVLVGALALAACDNNGTTDVPGTDATTDTGGITDTGVTTDTGSTPMDVVAPTDTGTVTDTGSPTDTGPTGTPLNGCTTFGSETTITFAGTAYTPNCIDVAAGTMVTFSGPFTLHPLRPGRAPSRPTTDTPSTDPTPIVNTDTGTSASFTFATAGDYGFYCAIHESLGMYGVVRVH